MKRVKVERAGRDGQVQCRPGGRYGGSEVRLRRVSFRLLLLRLKPPPPVLVLLLVSVILCGLLTVVASYDFFFFLNAGIFASLTQAS